MVKLLIMLLASFIYLVFTHLSFQNKNTDFSWLLSEKPKQICIWIIAIDLKSRSLQRFSNKV